MTTHDGQKGSMVVELVVLVPVIVLFAFMAIGLGRYESARQEVADAARAGAQAASIVASESDAPAAAESAALDDIQNQPFMCADPSVSTDDSSFGLGGMVRVTVTCHVQLSDVAIPGVPGEVAISVIQAAPIDRYRSVQ
jgi:Flp pilus assembly protein TadG